MGSSDYHFFSLTEICASREVVPCLFGVSTGHLASLRVELVETVSMETVVVPHVAESGRAVGHALEIFLLHSLGFDIEGVDVVTYIKK